MMVISLNNDLTVINDISETLKMLVENNISELPPNSVVFDSPADIQKSNKSGLSLFLYQISENADLKNQDMVDIGSNQIQSPPLALDLHYLLTPYAQTRQTEQIIMSKLVRTFHDNSIVNDSLLRNSLREVGNKELHIIFNTVPLEQINNLWSTFHDTPYKLSVSYLVTPILIPSDIIAETTRVLSKQSSFVNKQG